MGIFDTNPTQPAPSRPLTDHPRPAGRMRRRADEADLGLAVLTETHKAVLSALVGMETVAQAVQQIMAVPRQRVQWSGSAQLDANGVWSRRFGTLAKAIFVINPTGNGALTVVAAGQQGGAPGPGVGVHVCPAAAARTFNAETSDWTIYGTANQIVDVQVFGVYIPVAATGF